MSRNTDDADDSEPTRQKVGTDAEPAIVRYDWEQSGQPSVALVEAVAAATDRTTTDLPPLHHSIDPDALDTLLARGQSLITVAFTYAGTAVSVSGDGAVEVRIDASPTETESE